MKNLSIIMLTATLLVANVFVSKADTKQEIEKANKNGQVVFVVVTEKGNSQNQAALALAQKTKNAVQKTAVVELDRSNASNSALIKKYGLAGAPAPLILVIATNGYVAGGSALENSSVDALKAMVPTAKEELVIKAMNEGNSAFVVFSKKSDPNAKKQLEACASACSSMNGKAVTVNVDIDDAKEQSLFAKFNVDKNTKSPVTEEKVNEITNYIKNNFLL